MSLFICKMCGDHLEVKDGDKIVKCPSCDTVQTIPNTNDDAILKLINRGNTLRSQGEFDKAYGIFSQLFGNEKEDAEIYWNLLLCKYGITYVDDYDGKKKPTINRMSRVSILDDADYKKVISLADVVTRETYEYEAKRISDIQQNILKIASKEEPYDIFISYKETDEAGDRTRDSLLAQEIYDTLTKDGYRVFLSRVSLSKIIGKEYEPYIYSALYTSKIMLLIATDESYVNSVWVKNEWTRFLNMMKEDKNKTLIPCYKDLDPYDLPKEIRNLQGLDMSKLGFIQDLKSGVEKILGRKKESKANDEPKAKAKSSFDDESAADKLIKRGFQLLEQDKFEEACDVFEKSLDYEEKAYAYIGYLCCDHTCSTIDELYMVEFDISKDEDYINALRVATPEEKALLEKISGSILEKRNKKDQAKYDEAMKLKNNGDYRNAESIFYNLKTRSFLDSEEQKKECAKAIDLEEKEALYNKAIKEKDGGKFDAALQTIDTLLRRDASFKDAKEIKKEIIYQSGIASLNSNDYTNAKACFKTISGYKDSDKYLNVDCKNLETYCNGVKAFNNKNFLKAQDIFKSLPISYRNVISLLDDCKRKLDLISLNKAYNECAKGLLISNGGLDESKNIKLKNKELKAKREKFKTFGNYRRSYDLIKLINSTLLRRRVKRNAIIFGILLFVVLPGSFLTYKIVSSKIQEAEIAQKKADEFSLMQGKYGAPVLDFKNMTVSYGLYPQSVVDDSSLISELDNLTSDDRHSQNNFYYYNEEYYYPLTANPYKSNYVFNNGSTISSTIYWFKCEPIKWKMIDATDNSITLITETLLQRCEFDYDAYTRYHNSSIRSYINGTFYRECFALGDSFILESEINNGLATEDSCGWGTYYSSDTKDKLYLLSYQDVYTKKYKLSSDETDPYNSGCKTSDYLRALGAYCDQKEGFEYNGDYWTRSLCRGSGFPSCVNSNNTINHKVNNTYEACVRPCMQISHTWTEEEKNLVKKNTSD